MAAAVLAAGLASIHASAARRKQPAKAATTTTTAPATQPASRPASRPATRPARHFTEEWWELLKKGGKTMIFLLVLSVTALAYGLDRLFTLRRGVIVPPGLSAAASRLWAEGKYEEIIALADRRPSTLGRILQFIVRHRTEPVADISTTAGDIAAVELRYHARRCYPLAVVATLSPLLGLLGTVFGMIESFDVVAIAGALGDASQLAGGISKALITTAAGLVIAVPSLAAYHWFRERTNLYGDMLEKEVTDLVIAWLMTKEQPRAD
jgi:biopolymer transport protein ExbB